MSVKYMQIRQVLKAVSRSVERCWHEWAIARVDWVIFREGISLCQYLSDSVFPASEIYGGEKIDLLYMYYVLA